MSRRVAIAVVNVVVGISLLLGFMAAHAAVPGTISLQGILTDTSNNPLPNASYNVTFRIYDNAGPGGTILWSEATSVTTSNVLFTKLMGSVTPVPDSVFSYPDRWLGIQITGQVEMFPRTRISAVAYSFRPATVDGATGGNVSGAVHVSGDSEGLRVIGTGVGNPGGAYVGFADAANTSIGYIGDGSSSSQDMFVTSYIGNVKLVTPTGTALTASEGGFVGIGVSGFYFAKLTVLGGLDGGIYADSDIDLDAVYAKCPPGGTGYALYSHGRAHILGTLTKSSGAFMIDHPLDLENKYLYHSFVESPDMKNIYDGTVTLNSGGEAVVLLPDWFGALNKDFRYQLTAIGAPGPNLHVAQEVSGNQFRIAGGTAGMKVSWQVTGIRQDAYANAHRIPVEEDKPAKERGFYLHPELFSQPEEKGIEWARRPELMKQMKEEREKAASEEQ